MHLLTLADRPETGVAQRQVRQKPASHRMSGPQQQMHVAINKSMVASCLWPLGVPTCEISAQNDRVRIAEKERAWGISEQHWCSLPNTNENLPS